MVDKLKNYLHRVKSSPKAKILVGGLVIVGLATTVLSMRKTVIVSIDGKDQKIITYKGTVEGALHDNDIEIGPKDKVQPSVNSELSNNGRIAVHRAVKVNVALDGKKLTLQSAEKTVADMFKAEGISVDTVDKVQPSEDMQLTNDMNITVTRVSSKEVTEVKTLDYETVIRNDENLDKSVSKTVQEGKNGDKEITYKVVYEDGKEVSRKLVAEKVTNKPVNKIVVKGSGESVALSRGDSVIYKKKLNMTATAYSIGNFTASGARTSRNPSGWSTIAVDPNVIPLGTKVYIPGYGLAIAADTGTAIKNNKIDLFMSSYGDACNWGLRSVELYIIAYPGQ